MPVHNAEIAAIFEQTAELLEIKGEDQAGIRAYRRAARTIEALPLDVASLLERGVDPAAIPGIGKDFAPKIAAIVKTSQFDLLEALKRQLPGELGALAAIPGLGPKRVRLLYENLRVRTIDDLRRAAQEGRLRDIRGLGLAVEKRVIAVLCRPQQERRFGLARVQEEVDALVGALASGLADTRVAAAGSFRRRREAIGDLDLLVAGHNAAAVSERLVRSEAVADIRTHGPERTTVVLSSGLQVDLRVVADDDFGAALLYFTGSKRHNVALRTLAGVRGWKLNEYGLFAGKRKIAGASEEEIYAKLGLQFIPPELREDRGEIVEAREGRLPVLVDEADIRGDLHVACNWTDAHAPVGEFLAAARLRGYRCLALVDDASRFEQTSPVGTAGLKARIAEIARMADAGDVAVLTGIEADILADGGIDLPDEIAALPDFVAAGIHSKFDLPAAAQTDRVLRAIGDPRVAMLAHPTGRVMGRNGSCEFDFDRVVAAARESRCLLEINADPDRLDLDDAHARAAKAGGALIAIGSNADAPGALARMRSGVDQARRAWLTAADIVNTRAAADVRALLAR